MLPHPKHPSPRPERSCLVILWAMILPYNTRKIKLLVVHQCYSSSCYNEWKFNEFLQFIKNNFSSKTCKERLIAKKLSRFHFSYAWYPDRRMNVYVFSFLACFVNIISSLSLCAYFRWTVKTSIFINIFNISLFSCFYHWRLRLHQSYLMFG